ncbi:MAG: 3D domain-containing protein [Planctomycetota bacterium]
MEETTARGGDTLVGDALAREAFASTEERRAARRRGLFAGMFVVSAAGSLVALGIGTGRSATSASSLQGRDGAAVTVVQYPVSPLPEAGALESEAGLVDSGLVDSGLVETTPARILFDGRPIKPARTIRMKVTAYSPDERSCGASADGITASGHSVLTNGGFLVAADPKLLPLGSLVSVPGYDGGAVVPVLDVGGAIKGERLDVLFPTHEEARRWGVQHLDVTVWEYDDGRGSEFKRVRRKPRA